VRLLTTSTGNLALVGSWLREVQQLSESGRAGVMQSGTQRHFRGFQISRPALRSAKILSSGTLISRAISCWKYLEPQCLNR